MMANINKGIMKREMKAYVGMKRRLRLGLLLKEVPQVVAVVRTHPQDIMRRENTNQHAMQVCQPKSATDTSFEQIKSAFRHTEGITLDRNSHIQAVSLNALSRDFGQGVPVAVISQMIRWVDEVAGLKNKMNPIQIALLSQNITSKYGCYTSLVDIWFFVGQLALGELGTLYDRLNPSSFMAKFDKYISDKQNLIFERNLKKHEQLKERPEDRTSLYNRVRKFDQQQSAAVRKGRNDFEKYQREQRKFLSQAQTLSKSFPDEESFL